MVRGVILAGGDGTRMKADVPSKVLLEVDGGTLISRNVAMLAPHVDSIRIVVGRARDEIEAHIGDAFGGVPVSYSVQSVRDGPLGALKVALDDMGSDEDVFVVLGDEYIEGESYAEMLRCLLGARADCVIGIIPDAPAETIAQSYSVDCEEGSDRVTGVIEKPVAPRDGMRGTGHYMMRSRALGVIPFVPSRRNGQYEMTDLVSCLISQGFDVRAVRVAERELNVNTETVYREIRG